MSKLIMDDTTNPIVEKHTLLEKIFNQKYVLEAQGLLNKDTYDLMQYTMSPKYYEEANWKNVKEAFNQLGMRTMDAAKALSKLAEVWRNEQRNNQRRNRKM